MRHRAVRVLVFVFAFGCLGFGIQALAAGAKLPKCASVKCRDLGCPADVLCVSGSKVQSCAEVCNNN